MVDLRDGFLEVALGALGVDEGIGQFVLGAGDGVADGDGADGGEADADVAHGLLDEAELVVGVVDGEFGLAAQVVDIAPEDAEGLAVEGADVDPGRHAADQVDDALAHFVGGLVGEGDGEDVPGGDAGGDEIGDAAGDDAGLAGAGAGEDEQGAVDVVDGGALLGVQTAEIERHEAGGRGVVGGAHGRF